MKRGSEKKDQIIKRRQDRSLGVFIDGTGLDRAMRRINRKVDISALLRGVSSGLTPVVARYYALIPYEDDARQHSFLEAVSRAGLAVVVKRLPPKGVERQVSIDLEMATDIIAFCGGHTQFQDAVSRRLPDKNSGEKQEEEEVESANKLKIVTVICASRDLSYTLARAKELGADTVNADFSKSSRDVLRAAAKWIDLSDSETIWRD